MGAQDDDTALSNLLHQHRRRIKPEVACMWVERGRVLGGLISRIWNWRRNASPLAGQDRQNGPIGSTPA